MDLGHWIWIIGTVCDRLFGDLDYLMYLDYRISLLEFSDYCIVFEDQRAEGFLVCIYEKPVGLTKHQYLTAWQKEQVGKKHHNQEVTLSKALIYCLSFHCAT